MITPIGPTTPFVAVPFPSPSAVQPVAPVQKADADAKGGEHPRDDTRGHTYGRHGMTAAHGRGGRVDRRA